jgi:cysteine desulfurase
MRIANVIYLDHHATTAVDRQVLAEMLPYFEESFGNPHSVDHSLGWASARAVDRATSQIAALIGSDSDEIVFTSGATEANNLALFGLAHGPAARERNVVLLVASDHKSSLAVGRVLETRGLIVRVLPVDSDARIDMDALRANLNEKTLLLSMGLVNSEVGTIQDLPVIAELVHQHGALLHCDAAQAPCAMDMRMMAGMTDLLSLSAHKMYGPKGVGALFIRRSVQPAIAPMIHGGGQQNNLRSGTLPTPLCVGFGAAASLLSNADSERERVGRLRDLLLAELRKLPWPVSLNGSLNRRHPGNANIRFDGFAAEDLIATLQPHVAASTGSACTSGTPEPSYVLRAMGLSYEQASSSMRFCVGRGTTEADVLEAAGRVSDTLKQMAGAGLRHAV